MQTFSIIFLPDVRHFYFSEPLPDTIFYRQIERHVFFH